MACEFNTVEAQEAAARLEVVPSDMLEPSSTDGVQRWSCGHALGAHTRASAAECIASQRRGPRHEKGGASAPPDVAVFTDTTAPLVAADFCAEAARLVGGPRAATHGDQTLNFANIAELWNGYWRIKCRVNDERLVTPFTAHDVGCMMELFKIARRFSGSFNADDYIDAAGYAGCTGEIAAREQTKQNPST